MDKERDKLDNPRSASSCTLKSSRLGGQPLTPGNVDRLAAGLSLGCSDGVASLSESSSPKPGRPPEVGAEAENRHTAQYVCSTLTAVYGIA